MLNDIEMKLLRLALDKGAYEGEADNAAIMFIRKLRERNVKADDLFYKSNSEKSSRHITSWHYYKMPFGKYKNKMLMDIPEDYLLWVLQNCRSVKPDLRNAIENIIFGV